jgi:hypothetical protein
MRFNIVVPECRGSVSGSNTKRDKPDLIEVNQIIMVCGYEFLDRLPRVLPIKPIGCVWGSPHQRFQGGPQLTSGPVDSGNGNELDLVAESLEVTSGLREARL